MAQKKKTTKTKKLHPGGSVPTLGGRRLSPAEIRLNRRGAGRGRKTDREIAQAGGFKSMRQMQAAMERMTPEQRMQFQRKNATRFRDIAARNRGEFETRNAKLLERVRRQQRRRAGFPVQPTMPTAGISQGRPVRGLTPMPGPAPDPARQRRMDNLMREAQRRFNQQQRNRAQVSKATTLRRKTLSPVERTRMENARKAADRMLGRSRPTPPRDGTRRGRTSGSR